MGTKAYVLIEVAVGKAKMVADEILSLEGVKTVDVVYGNLRHYLSCERSRRERSRVSGDRRYPHHRRRATHPDVPGPSWPPNTPPKHPQDEAAAP